MLTLVLPLPDCCPLWYACPTAVAEVCTVVPGYRFFPNMDHSGDDLTNANGDNICASMGDVQYALGAFQAETKQYSLMPAGFTVMGGAGSFEACAKTSAIGTSEDPVLNTPTPDTGSEFSGPCAGAYILIPVAPGG